MKHTAGIALAAATVAVLAPVTADAQEAIRQDCLAHVASASKLTFNPGKHQQWYNRFWNGKCGSLTLFGDKCTQSEPGWNQATANILQDAGPQASAEVLAKACKLGALIGYEWAKDNNVRCIHTSGANSLVTLRAIVKDKKGGDMLKRLDLAEAKAKSMCKSLQPPTPRS